MRIKEFHLKSFRGFTDLHVKDIPDSAKLIMLIGPNGTGKSSIFDALISWAGSKSGTLNWDDTFHFKHGEKETKSWSHAIENFVLHGPTKADGRKNLAYVRSAHRHEAEFGQGNLSSVPSATDRRFNRTIDNDAAISENYRRLIMQAVSDIFKEAHRPSVLVSEYADTIKNTVNRSLEKVLPHLKLESLGNPESQSGNFFFTKGKSKGYLFKNLSGGEKAVFDIILDLRLKSKAYDDSLVCIDEPECHINPAVHGALLEELLDLTPPNSQLIIATHAIGMLRKARDLESKKPGSVAFLNFEQNFDQPVVLLPTKMDRSLWERSLAVALDDLSALVAPKRIIICEGGPCRNTDDAFDSYIYETIFQSTEPDTKFWSAGSKDDVVRARNLLAAIAPSSMPGLEVASLVDRDDRSDAEVAVERAQGRKVLTVRNLECYLFSDEIIGLLCNNSGQPELATELMSTRQKLLNTRSRPDDLKAISGQFYVVIKNQLKLERPGNNAKAFMRDTLAPLITPETRTYAKIYQDVFGTG
ncbi:MAG: AAA family ATPase [Hyphomicrobium sp.]|nr:AAA family ATPase [Hyphomicrobium sp.]